MNNMSELPNKTVKIHKLPVVIKKNALTPIDKLKTNYEFLFRCVKNATQNLIKEDIIYKASDRDIFNGKYPNLVITNRLNVLKNASRTIATYEDGKATVELSSDSVTKVIGQKNYDTVFSALCSVISQDLKVQGIFSLLSSTENLNVAVGKAEKFSQTDQTCRDIIIRDKQRRHIKKKQIRSYIVQDDMLPEKQMRKVIINPSDYPAVDPGKIKIEYKEKSSERTPEVVPAKASTDAAHQLPDLKGYLDEDSNISDTSIGNISIGSYNIPHLLDNPKVILSNIDKHTKETNIDTDNLTNVKMIDGSYVMVRGNPDIFHYSSPEILEHLSKQDRSKILLHQALIDWKFCLQPNEDGNLPIHWAVLNDDVELLKRQCIVLKSRQESVDITSGGKTALQLAVLNDCAKCTAVLLTHGADPLVPDEESRTPFHLAAEVSSENVLALIEHCKANAREILKDNEGLWRDHFDTKSDKDLADYLMYKLCTMCDNQGYTPLMMASRIGNHEAVKLLLEASPATVNMGMPNCGNTALYLAVSAACLDCHERGDKTTVSANFMSTIEVLVENGADPAVDNNSGGNVNVLLTEFCISKLSMLIANKLTLSKYFLGNKLKSFDSYMLVKDNDGTLNLKELKTNKNNNKSDDQKVVDDKEKYEETSSVIKTRISTKAPNEVVNDKITAKAVSDVMKERLKPDSVIKEIQTVNPSNELMKEKINAQLTNDLMNEKIERNLVTGVIKERIRTVGANEKERMEANSSVIKERITAKAISDVAKERNAIKVTKERNEAIVRMQESRALTESESELRRRKTKKRKPAILKQETVASDARARDIYGPLILKKYKPVVKQNLIHAKIITIGNQSLVPLKTPISLTRNPFKFVKIVQKSEPADPAPTASNIPTVNAKKRVRPPTGSAKTTKKPKVE